MAMIASWIISATLMTCISLLAFADDDHVVGRLTAAFPGCNPIVGPESILSIGASTCATAPRTFAPAPNPDRSGAGPGQRSAAAYAIPVLIIALIILILCAQNANGKPVSP